MGGEEKIRALKTLHFEASLIRSELEESERPEGPYILENDQVEEWRDLEQKAWKNTNKLHGQRLGGARCDRVRGGNRAPVEGHVVGEGV